MGEVDMKNMTETKEKSALTEPQEYTILAWNVHRVTDENEDKILNKIKEVKKKFEKIDVIILIDCPKDYKEKIYTKSWKMLLLLEKCREY